MNGYLGVFPGTNVGNAIGAFIAAYSTIATKPVTTILDCKNFGGQTLTPGVYLLDYDAKLGGQLTLAALGNPFAVRTFHKSARHFTPPKPAAWCFLTASATPSTCIGWWEPLIASAKTPICKEVSCLWDLFRWAAKLAASLLSEWIRQSRSKPCDYSRFVLSRFPDSRSDCLC